MQEIEEIIIFVLQPMTLLEYETMQAMTERTEIDDEYLESLGMTLLEYNQWLTTRHLPFE